MSIRINTHFGEVISSKSINEKVDALFGGNAIIDGFDVTKISNKSIEIAPGKAIVCGASIEESEDINVIAIPDELLSKRIIYAIIKYNHDQRQVLFEIVSQIPSNSVVLAEIEMSNSIISKVSNRDKVIQMNELSAAARDLKSGLLNTQHLELSGESILMEDGCRSKTEDINLKGNARQNLVLTPNKDIDISGEFEADASTAHNIGSLKNGHIDVSVKGRTIQNMVNKRTTFSTAGSAPYTGLVNQIDAMEVNITGEGSMVFIKYAPLKNNTIYTVACYIKCNAQNHGSFAISFRNGSSSHTQGLINVPLKDKDNYHLYIAKLTTSPNCNAIVVGAHGGFLPGDSIGIRNLVLLEGDWTNVPARDIPYVEGICGVGDKGKNLFNTVMEIGAIDQNNGNNSLSTTISRSKDYIEVQPLRDYVISFKNQFGTFRIFEYDINRTLIKHTMSNTIKTDWNTRYIRFHLGIAADSKLEEIQLEEGVVATAYHSHKCIVRVSSSGKNLLDLTGLRVRTKEFTTYEQLQSNSLKIITAANNTDIWSSVMFENFKFKPGVTYRVTGKCTWSHPSNRPMFSIRDGFDNSKVLRSLYFDKETIDGTFTATHHAHRIEFFAGNQAGPIAGTYAIFEDFMIMEEPNTSRAFELFSGTSIEYDVDEPLMSLSSSIYDEITNDGELIRRVRKIVLDSGYRWDSNTPCAEGYIRFKCMIDDFNYESSDSSAYSLPSINDKMFARVNEAHGAYEYVYIQASSNGTIAYVQISNGRNITSVSEFLTWLNKDPINVYHQILKPTRTPLDMRVALPSGASDKVCSDGMVERRIKTATFNGTEVWNTIPWSSNDNLFFAVLKGFDVANASNAKISIKASNMKSIRWSDLYEIGTEGISIYLSASNSTDINVGIAKSKLSTPDINGFKKWLSQNPMTVWYEVKNPYKEHYNYQRPRLISCSGTTHVDCKNIVKANLVISSKGQKYPALLRKATKYLVRLNATTTDLGVNIDLGGSKATLLKNQQSIYVTTPDPLTHHDLYVSGWGSSVDGVMVTEHSYDGEYINGIVSSGEPSKNLFNGNYIIGKKIEPDGAIVSDSTSVIGEDYIEVNPGEVYSMIRWREGQDILFGLYDGNKNKMGRSRAYSFKVPHGCKYIIPYIWNYNADNTPLSSTSNIKMHVEKTDIAKDYAEYHDGYKIEISNKGKNLFDKNNYKTGGASKPKALANIGDIAKMIATGDKSHRWIIMKLPINKTYTLTMDKTEKYPYNWGNNIMESDSDNLADGNKYRSLHSSQHTGSDIWAATFTTTMPYVFIHYGHNANWDSDTEERIVSSIQIEESKVQTSYESYKKTQETICLNEPLMKLPNGVCDELIGDKIIKRIGKATFSGNEDWSLNAQYPSTGGIQFTWNFGNKIPKPIVINRNQNMYCSTRAVVAADSEPNAAWIYGGSTIAIQLKKSEVPDLNSFREWLKLNPTTIYYELETPLMLDAPKRLSVRTYDNTNNIFTNCKVKPTMTLKMASNLKAVVRKITERITEAENIVDELLLPNIVETDYERTLLEFNYEMDQLN